MTKVARVLQSDIRGDIARVSVAIGWIYSFSTFEQHDSFEVWPEGCCNGKSLSQSYIAVGNSY